jgi:hypothetical protein
LASQANVQPLLSVTKSGHKMQLRTCGKNRIMHHILPLMQQKTDENHEQAESCPLFIHFMGFVMSLSPAVAFAILMGF